MAILKKLKKGLKKVAKPAALLGAAYLASKGLGRKKQMKDYLQTEGGDKSDMRDYGPFTKKRSSYIADNRSQSVLGQGKTVFRDVLGAAEMVY